MADTMDNFLDEVEEYKGRYYFRGQADVSWDITPSIFRNGKAITSEHLDIGEVYSNSRHKDILFKLLEMQHYGSKTRLCDLTVNPLVALFFALDGDGSKDKDGSVYILDCSNRIPFDSIEIRIMTKVATSNITNITQLKEEICKDFGIDFTHEEIKRILFQNAIMEYNYEFTFSNPRSHLQGGTAIFFGYASPDGELIERKNNYGIHNIIKRIIIPSNRKAYFLNELKKCGITSETLYDRIFEYRMKSKRSINYSVEIDKITRTPAFNKVVLWIRLDDMRFISNDIFPIVDAVFMQMKRKYGDTARIFMIVYYDAEDKKATNFICNVSPINDFMSFTINWNADYFKRRMDYTHQQISSQEIIARFEPIISEFLSKWRQVKKKNKDLRRNLINREEYGALLKDIIKRLNKLAYWDSQDIAHGGDKIYDYQESGHMLISDIMLLIEEQVMYIDKQANDYLLQYSFNHRNDDCEKNYKVYIEKKAQLSIKGL